MATLTREESGESNKDFLFLAGELKDASEQVNNIKIDVNFPSDDDTKDSTFSLNLGTEQKITLQFKLYTTDTDRSNGTNTTAVETYSEIITYLKRTMFKPSIGTVLYRLQMTTKFETIDAYFDVNNIRFKTDNSIYPSGEIELKFRYYA